MLRGQARIPEHLVEWLDGHADGLFKLCEDAIIAVEQQLFFKGNLFYRSGSGGRSGGSIVTLGGGIIKRISHDFERFDHVRGQGVDRVQPVGLPALHHGKFSLDTIQLCMDLPELVLQDRHRRFHFAALFFAGQQLGLHGRYRAQGRGKALLGGEGFHGAAVAFGGHLFQAQLIGFLIAHHLLAGVARADAVHQENCGGHDGPPDQSCTAAQGDGLMKRAEPDEPRFCIRTQKQALFR